jgi:hypothetical protein
MTVEEIDLLAQLSEIDPDNLDDDSIASLLEEALVITDDDIYEAISFITENSEIDHNDLHRVYTTLASER